MGIPDYQAVPFPAPLWFMQFFLVFGFFLHLIPMNFIWTGSLLSGVFLMISGNNRDSKLFRLGDAIAKSLPVFLSFAITQGIVPLLFLQLVYGPLYYSSAIIMAVPWLSVIFLLLIAYYALYVYKLKSSVLGAWGPWILISCFLLFSLIGFIFSNNMTLMLRPDVWHTKMSLVSHGFNLNLDDYQLYPRFLHFFISAFAISGLVISCFSFFTKDQSYAEFTKKTGALFYLASNLVGIPVAIWFLTVFPKNILRVLMHDNQLSAVSFMLGVALALFAMLFAILTITTKQAWASIGMLMSALVSTLAMCYVRHALRVALTAEYLDPSMVAVNIQWDILIVFLVLFIALLGYLVWLSRLVLKAYQK